MHSTYSNIIHRHCRHHDHRHIICCHLPFLNAPLVQKMFIYNKNVKKERQKEPKWNPFLTKSHLENQDIWRVCVRAFVYFLLASFCVFFFIFFFFFLLARSFISFYFIFLSFFNYVSVCIPYSFSFQVKNVYKDQKKSRQINKHHQHGIDSQDLEDPKTIERTHWDVQALNHRIAH